MHKNEGAGFVEVSNGKLVQQVLVAALNLFVNIVGVAMILYSLCLLKTWTDDGFSPLLSPSPIPKPWFIYTCLGIGIVVCLSCLSAHMVANCMTSSILALYIIFICVLLGVQGSIIFSTFFKIDWRWNINHYIDDSHKKLKKFVLFHLAICKLVTLSVFLIQMKAVLLAMVVWVMGVCNCSSNSEILIPNGTYSFLVDQNADELHVPTAVEINLDVE